MGKGRLAFILLLSAVIFSGQVLAQSGRKLAPLRKRLPQAVVADSTIGQKPRLRLETIEINRLRVERLPGFSRQQIALQKDVLQTSNPLMNLRFLSVQNNTQGATIYPVFRLKRTRLSANANRLRTRSCSYWRYFASALVRIGSEWHLS
jgi:hypothetical protein